MQKKINKNYFSLVVLLAFTVVLTLFISNLYLSRNKLVSEFYEYSNKITTEEFNSYMTENSDAIIYISDKYDLTNAKFEEKFRDKIDNLNIKNKMVYIEKSEIDKQFIDNLEKKYKNNIEISDYPIVLVIVDNKIIKSVNVNNETDVDNFINYEVFE